MATYQEIKDRVYADAAGKQAKNLGVHPHGSVHIRNATLHSILQAAGSEEWLAHRVKAVCGEGAAEMPSPADASPLVISATHTAIPNIGGIFTESMDGLPVTVDAVENRTSWVMTNTSGQYVAMRLDDAFRRGLREVEWPNQ